MQHLIRKGKLSLTSRLALFFTVVATAVVLGLGGLFLVVTEKHFVELDRMTLQAPFDRKDSPEHQVGR